jgi:DNA-binding response OmpR family regulator
MAEGYHVTSFVDPVEGLSMVAQLSPDLIILDWIFQRDTVGQETLRRLLALPAVARTRVLVITGAVHQVQDLRSEFIAQNIPILYKPFSLDELLAAVRRLVPAQPRQG